MSKMIFVNLRWQTVQALLTLILLPMRGGGCGPKPS